jgi:anthranilate phosphoribosyltransferase
VLGRLGSRRALVVWGEGNLDEMTVTGATRVAEWNGHEVVQYSVHPEDVGLSRATLEEIRGADTPAEAAAQMRRVLGGEAGPRLDMVLLNSGAALMAAGRAANLLDGVIMARETVSSGAALAKVDALVGFCGA